MGSWRRRETSLLEFSLFFFAGNILTHYFTRFTDSPGILIPAFFVLFSLTFITVLLLRGCEKTVIKFILFFFLGSLGYSDFAFFKSFQRKKALEEQNGKCEVLKENSVFEIKGIAEKIGRSRSGKRFVQLKLTNENTILYNIPEELSVKPGNLISAKIRTVKIENFSDDYDYKKIMNDNGIYCSAFLTKERKICATNIKTLNLKYLSCRLKERYINYIRKLLGKRCSEETMALAIALTCGERSFISRKMNENFRKSGSMHLFALSGLHLGIIYAILSGVLSFLGNYLTIKRIRSVIIIIVLWAYSIFTGLGVSILRAVIMITIYEIAVIFSKERNGINALAMSILIIGTFIPSSPSSTGFQLSCGAMAGIFLIYPSMKNIIPFRNKFLQKIYDLAALSISCQIITLPLILIRFRTYSPFSLLANILCANLTALIMILIPITILITSVIPCTGEFSSFILNIFMETLIKINEIIASL